MVSRRSGEPVPVDDSRVLAMPTEECGEPLVDLREYPILASSANPGFGRVKSDARTRLFCREGVARRLVRADGALSGGLRLLVHEVYRPVELQRALWEEALGVLRERHPEWSARTLARENVKFIAPPGDAPPHSTGGAVDVTLVDYAGAALDMGSPLNGNSSMDRTFAAGTSEEGMRNRKLLLTAMESAGFENYGYEWWHYSYGDRYWSFMEGRAPAVYGPVSPGKCP